LLACDPEAERLMPERRKEIARGKAGLQEMKALILEVTINSNFIALVRAPLKNHANKAAKSAAETICVALWRSSESNPLLSPVTR
jgi:hypothetical protein